MTGDARPAAAASQLRPDRRLYAIDAARGLALIGMIIVNVGPIASDSAVQRLWLAPYGRASVLFVLVAGVSMTLLLRRDATRRRSPVVFWRAGILLLGGLALGLLPHGVNVILPLYGVLFLVALAVHRLPTWALIAAASIWLIAGPVLYLLENAHQVGKATPVLEWTGSPLDLLHTLVVTRPYPLVVWVVPFLVGMTLGRLDLRSSTVQKRMITIGAAAAVMGFAAGEVAPAILGPIERGPLLLLTAAPHGQMPLWLITSIGSALFVVGGLLLLWSRIGQRLGILVITGQTALTLYVVHLVILALVRPADGFTFLQGVTMSLTLVAGCLLIAALIRRRFSSGPLEWALRARWLETGR